MPLTPSESADDAFDTITARQLTLDDLRAGTPNAVVRILGQHVTPDPAQGIKHTDTLSGLASVEGVHFAVNSASPVASLDVRFRGNDGRGPEYAAGQAVLRVPAEDAGQFSQFDEVVVHTEARFVSVHRKAAAVDYQI